jgi:hypothetical protein
MPYFILLSILFANKKRAAQNPQGFRGRFGDFRPFRPPGITKVAYGEAGRKGWYAAQGIGAISFFARVTAQNKI